MSACTTPGWWPIAIYAALAVGCAVGVILAAVMVISKGDDDEL